jgi:hypothetical protein
MKPIKMFYIIKSNFTEDLYKWMKIQFLDICSNGDIIINNLLDDLNSHNKLINEKEFSKYVQYVQYIPYIYDLYINNYLKGESANPWWAS